MRIWLTLKRYALLLAFLLAAVPARAALKPGFDVDAFLGADFSVSMERVEKWSRSGRTHDDNQQLATDLAAEFERTHDSRYARAALKIFSAYADRYKDLEAANHNDRNGGALYAQLLDEARWLVHMAEAYEILLAADAAPAQEREHITQGLFEPAVAVQMGGDMPNNHQWWFNAAIGVCGYVLGREDWVDTAVNGPRGFRFHLANHINDDGLIFEQAMTYQHFAFVAYAHMAGAAARHGQDLWHMRADDGKSLKFMLDAVAHVTFPDSTMPALKDSGPQGRSFVQPFYTDFADFYKEQYSSDTVHLQTLQALAAAQEALRAGRVPKPVAPPEGSFALNGITQNGTTLFPSSGLAVLRQNAHNLDAPAATFEFGPYGGGHGHPDKLSITLYGFGEHMLPDTGRYEYGDPLQRSWANQTLAHNTVVVDRTSQAPMTVPGMSIWAEPPPGDAGVLREFFAGELLQLTRATYRTHGADLDRTVALFGGALIDVFRVTSDKPRVLDYVLHVNGAYTAGSLGLREYPRKLGRDFGYQHLEAVTAANREPPAPWHSDWRTPGGHGLHIAALGAGRLVATAAAPGNPPDTRLPMLLLRDKGTDVRFVTVMTPYANPANPGSVLVSGNLSVAYLEETSEPPPVGLLLQTGEGAFALALAPGGVLYDLNGWMRTDARAAGMVLASENAGQQTVFVDVSRINHGGPGLGASQPLRSLVLSHVPGASTKIEIYTDTSNTFTMGDEMVFSITAECARPGLRVNGVPRDLPKALDLALEPGLTTVEFVCE